MLGPAGWCKTDREERKFQEELRVCMYWDACGYLLPLNLGSLGLVLDREGCFTCPKVGTLTSEG